MSGVIRPLALAGVLAVALAPAALAAPTWVAPVSLSSAGDTIATPSVSLVDGGLGIEAWSENNGTRQVIRVAQHALGGSWTTLPGDISSSLPGDACNPTAAIDPAGNALVVWAQYAGPGCYSGAQTILSARRPAGASAFTAPAVVAPAGTYGDWSPVGASNANGQIVIGFQTQDATNSFIWGAVGSTTSGFEAPTRLLAAPLADALYYPAAAIGPSGDAAVQWQHNAGSNANIEIALHPKGGTFPTTPMALTSATAPNLATIGSVAINGAGDVVSAYSFFDSGLSSSSFVARVRVAGVWTPQQTIATMPSGLTASWISAGMDAGGTASVVYVETNFSSAMVSPYLRRLFSAARAPGATANWSNQAPLTDFIFANYSTPVLAVAPSGAAVANWEITTPSNVAEAVYRPAGGQFGALTPVGDGAASGTAGTVGLAPSGDAAVAFAGPSTDARVAVFDTSPPAITAATVPATATVGQAVPMSTVAADAWSPLAANQPAWSFGDGAGAAGASVSHAYAAPGTYTVTIGASDALGLAAPAVTRQITISAAVVPPPPPTPATSIAKPKTSLRYVASRLVGSVRLSGTSGAKAVLTVTIQKHGARKPSVASRFTANGGAWTRTVKLPSGLTPGRYDVVVGGANVTSSSTSFSIAAPVAGIVSRAYASGPRRGPAVTRLSHSSELWAHFSFGTLPKKRQTITTQWILPSGSKLAANTRPRTTLVEAQVKDLSGKPLPTGRWRCVIRAGTAVVATLTVRIT